MTDEKRLYLVRHAIAAERGEAFPDDGKRPLTEKGIERFREIVAGLTELDVEIDVVLTSPLVRARQTADLLATGLRSSPRLVETRALAPGASYQALLDELAVLSDQEAIALVGHEPGLGQLAGRLIGTRHPLPFKKGGVCRIDLDGLPPAGPGRLVWFATPRMLRGIG